jgi:hypothetical protein
MNLTSGKKFTLDGVDLVFNKSLLINEREIAEIAQISKGIISDETIVANHPWVTDVQEELKKLEAQNEIKIDLNDDDDAV